MSILCCCQVDHAEQDERHPEPIDLPTPPPAAALSKTTSQPDTDVFSSLRGSRGASRLVTPTYQNIVDPEAVDVDDSDDEVQARTPKSTINSAFGSMKMKLFRGISRRVMNNNSRPQTLGPSDEEVARRAELKRLMHKRIQDELKREEVDEDSASTSLENYPTGHHKEPELPGGGPRDTIEFDVAGESQGRIEYAALEETQKSHSQESDNLRSTSHCPGSPTHQCNGSFDQKHPASHPSSSPHRSLHHLSETSGRCSPSIASWRLSYSASQISNYLALAEGSQEHSCLHSLELDRPVFHDGEGNTSYCSRDHASAPSSTTPEETMNTNSTVKPQQLEAVVDNRQDQVASNYLEEPSEDQGSALNIWLRTQEPHSNSTFSGHFNSHILLGNADQTQRHQRVTTAELRSPQPVDVVASVGTECERSGLNVRTQKTISEAWPRSSDTITDAEHHHSNSPSTESLALQQVINQMENIIRRGSDHIRNSSSRYTSSRYTTSQNSQGTAPQASHLSLSDLRGNPEPFPPLVSSDEPVRPYHVKNSEKTDTSSYKTAPNNKSSSECTRADTSNTYLPADGTGSVTVSHTTSFEQREEELRSIEKRFGSAPMRSRPPVPVHSRFHEVFDDHKNAGSVSSSFLSKLHGAFSKKSTTPASLGGTERKSIPQLDHSENANATNMLRSAFTSGSNSDSPSKLFLPVTPESGRNEEGMNGLRQRARARDVERYPGRLKAKLSKTSVCNNMTESNAATRDPSLAMSYGVGGSLRPTISEGDDISPVGHPSGHCSIQADQEGTTPRITFDDPIDLHACVLQEWVEQLQEEDAARRSSRITTPKPRVRKLRTPPASWAKWPSETRAARTGSAGESDLVTARDFADASSPSSRKEKTERRLTEKKSFPSSRALSDHIGRLLKSKWDKIIMHKTSAERTTGQAPPSPEVRSYQDHLEYPELELLPTGTSAFREMQALEKQIDDIKRRSVSLAPSSRFSTDYHKGLFVDAMNTSLPLTPNTQGDFPNTPQPHTSYDDCVQTESLKHDNTTNANVIQTHNSKRKRALSTGNIHIKSPSHLISASPEVRNDPTYLSAGWSTNTRRPQSAEGAQRTVFNISSSLGDSSRAAET